MKTSLKILLLASALSLISTPIANAGECDEVEVLALNMYHEARGEGTDGMLMVAEVTLNRVDHPSYPDDVCGVVYQRRQFSWVTQRKNHVPAESNLWEKAVTLAEEVLAGEVELLGTGATHYLNPDRVRKIPRWAREYEKVGRVGKHVFYRM
jgi:N-acetylmuramoyl-L-alanine amidase